ncbi:hypothetical protein [Flavobacterium sp. CS20]|uniref:hypothetical protein n=1 Tax=Flavobacterium sp. CS20 TaxID=2775246 RepID=UPI001B3A4AF1|nr:hypothetical protein [Flavobacterium sp. CS20]QTY26245.1 hypothetical protein IGB25_09765 [Flavobacterium sp. CS20]
MKNLKLLFVVSLITLSFLFSRKSDSKNKSDENNAKEIVESQFKTYHGEFIDVDTVMVLNGNSFIYGVKMDEQAKRLIKKVDAIKKDDYDVIKVIVKGELHPNTEEGWDEILTIKSIDSIYKPELKKETKVVKFSSKQNE